MPTKSQKSQKEQETRSKLKETVSEQNFIKGSLVKRMLTCGNPTCKCAKGKKHPAFYLGIRYKNKRQMIHVPKDWVPVVKEWVKTHKTITALLEIISAASIEKLMRGKASVQKEE